MTIISLLTFHCSVNTIIHFFIFNAFFFTCYFPFLSMCLIVVVVVIFVVVLVVILVVVLTTVFYGGIFSCYHVNASENGDFKIGCDIFQVEYFKMYICNPYIVCCEYK